MPMGTPAPGAAANWDALDRFLSAELPRGQQRSGNRENLVKVIHATLELGERVLAVAPCQYTGGRASGVLVITNLRVQIIDQREPGLAYQNVNWWLSAVTGVRVIATRGPRLLPSTSLEFSTADQTILVRNLVSAQAEKVAGDIQGAIDRYSRPRPKADRYVFICYSAFIACFSSASLDREKAYQNAELKLAVEELHQRQPGRRWLIPVRFDDCSISDLYAGVFGAFAWTDLFGPDRDRNAARLVQAIREIIRPTE
jgi:hypothetical protein